MRSEERQFLGRVGERIASARHQLGWTQSKLAHEIGVPRSAISQMESGSHRVPIYYLARLSQVLRIPIEALVPPLPDRVRIGWKESEAFQQAPEDVRLTIEMLAQAGAEGGEHE